MVLLGEDASQALAELVRVARDREPAAEADAEGFVLEPGDGGAPHYAHRNERLGIDFTVHRLPFPGLQVFDPRVVRIAPGACNERHRHAHESLFLVLEGEGELVLGARSLALSRGALAFVPRWLMHQTRNVGASPLVVLALTDFGFTSAVLGDYDARTRLKHHGPDSAA